jgi:hypothetical protein
MADRRGRGRPRSPIDPVELEKLAGLNCTIEEIAAWFNCSEKTIDRYFNTPKGRDAINRGRAKGRISVRREQFKLLQSGNATMGIWLGKQLLGQRDLSHEARAAAFAAATAAAAPAFVVEIEKDPEEPVEPAGEPPKTDPDGSPSD